MWQWIAHLLGLDNASGPTYLFWSGFFGDTTIIGGAILLYLHHNCHVKGCPRIGRHPFQHYKLCAKHHPAVPSKVTHLHIMKLHKNRINENTISPLGS